MQYLALQVRKRHRIVVDDGDAADAGGGQVEQRGRAKAASADHQRMGAPQPRLAGAPDLPQHDVTGVAFEIVVAQRHWDLAITDAPLS